MTTLAYSPWGTGEPSCYPFGKLFDKVVDGTKYPHGFKADALVLWGGTDIPPEWYGKKPHPYNQCQHGPSARDKWEWKAAQYCVANNIPIIGVCRGAQLLCALAGGSLIQHVNGHHSTHGVETEEGKYFSVTSCHHQMLDISGLSTDKAQHIAWATHRLSGIGYEGETKEDVITLKDGKEPEIVYFPHIKGLAIQGHPEWAREESSFVEYCQDLVSSLLLNKEPA